MRNQERERVRNTLATLAPRQSRLLLLRHTGYSYSEIATILNVASSSIGTLLVRAERAFLKQYQEIALQQCESTRLLRAYLDEALPTAQTKTLRAHLVTCTECQHLLEDLRQLRAQVSARFIVQQPHQEVLNHMVYKLLEQARELRLAGQWKEAVQLAEQAIQQDDVSAVERAEFYALTANAYLHLGDKDSAQRLLLKLEEEQNALPAEHKLHNEVRTLKAELDETTPEGQWWQLRHKSRSLNIESLNRSEIHKQALEKIEATKRVLMSPTASIERRCEAGFSLVQAGEMGQMIRRHDQDQPFSPIRQLGKDLQYKQPLSYLSQLEKDLQQLPDQHYLRKKVKRYKDFRSGSDPDGKMVMLLGLVNAHQYEQALSEAEQLIQMEEATVDHHCIAYMQMIQVYHNQGNTSELEQCLAKLMQTRQLLHEASLLRDEIQEFHRRITNQPPPGPITRLLWHAEDARKESSWPEVIMYTKPILEMESATEKERDKAYFCLGLAYVRLKQREELRRLCARFNEEVKDLPEQHLRSQAMKGLESVLKSRLDV